MYKKVQDLSTNFRYLSQLVSLQIQIFALKIDRVYKI